MRFVRSKGVNQGYPWPSTPSRSVPPCVSFHRVSISLAPSSSAPPIPSTSN
ncbi:hypothetical protein HMI55_000058 [Coelomomyces lativittatus]|nr:hypothetical protein HMI55_000058 [Coelomomyces lativittatus]